MKLIAEFDGPKQTAQFTCRTCRRRWEATIDEGRAGGSDMEPARILRCSCGEECWVGLRAFR